MKGWVYVASMSNTVGVLKIGHSTRDPDERVQEWANDTGAPGTARVEYAALVNNPASVEQAVHRRLSKYRERGEWFKCDVPATVMAIRQCAEVLYEDDRAQAREEAARHEGEERARQERERQKAAKRIPQNVNFAISAFAARSFLDAQGVAYDLARSDEERPVADIAAEARGYTVRIECWQ